MSALLILLIIFGSIFGLFILFRLFYSNTWYNVLFSLLIAGIILYVYWILGGIVYSFFKSTIKFKTSKKNMELWDTIWYLIFIVFLITILTVFVKMLKNSGNTYLNIFMYVFGLGFLLFFYTIMYYLYVYYEDIPKITGILVAIAVGLTVLIKIVEIFTEMPSPVYVLYGITLMVTLMCVFVFIFYIMTLCYDWLIV